MTAVFYESELFYPVFNDCSFDQSNYFEMTKWHPST